MVCKLWIIPTRLSCSFGRIKSWAEYYLLDKVSALTAESVYATYNSVHENTSIDVKGQSSNAFFMQWHAHK